MTKTKAKNLNGSVELLAQAMHKVFTECMEGVRLTVKEDADAVVDEMGKMENRLKTEIQSGQKTTDTNVQSQLAEQRKEIATLLSNS